MRLPRASERDEQVALFQKAEAYEHRHPELALLFAVPNGGQRNKIVAARMKAEGVKPGVPDIAWPIARGGYHALFIEMKRMKPRRTKTKGLQMDRTKPTPEQRRWMDGLTAAGNLCVICWSAEEAWQAITEYLDGQHQRAA